MQARSGCACAGPYGAILLDPLLNRVGVPADSIQACIFTAEREVKAREARPVCPTPAASACDCAKWLKPGFCRMYFSYLTKAAEFGYVVDAVSDVANHGWRLLAQYSLDAHSGAPACLLTGWRSVA